MKKLVALMLVVAFGVFAASASAETVSINVESGNNTLASADVAGKVPSDNWNNVTVAGGPSGTYPGPVVNSSGGATSMVIDWDPGYAVLWADPVSGSGPNVTMMGGSSMTTIGNHRAEVMGVCQVQLTNVVASVGGSYDLYVYYGIGLGGGPGNMLLSGAGTFDGNYPTGGEILGLIAYQTLSSNYTSPNSSGLPVYDSTTGFIYGSPGPGNYVKFEGVALDTVVITPQIAPAGPYHDFDGTSIQGIQVVGPETIVPEPAGLGLIGLALLAVRTKRS